MLEITEDTKSFQAIDPAGRQSDGEKRLPARSTANDNTTPTSNNPAGTSING
jgi:hypothetical protein